MRMEKLTSKFQEALGDAQSLAVGRDHQFIEPVHLMLALLDQQGGSIRPLFTHAGVNINLLRSQLNELLDKQSSVEGAGGDLPGRHPALMTQVGNTARDDPGRAGAGAGQDEQRPVGVGHRLLLRIVEAFQNGRGHEPPSKKNRAGGSW